MSYTGASIVREALMLVSLMLVTFRQMVAGVRAGRPVPVAHGIHWFRMRGGGAQPMTANVAGLPDPR